MSFLAEKMAGQSMLKSIHGYYTWTIKTSYNILETQRFSGWLMLSGGTIFHVKNVR